MRFGQEVCESSLKDAGQIQRILDGRRQIQGPAPDLSFLLHDAERLNGVARANDEFVGTGAVCAINAVLSGADIAEAS